MPYTVNGQELPSVTTITGMLDKPALIPWTAKMMKRFVLENVTNIDMGSPHALENLLDAAMSAGKAERDRSAGVGTETHDMLEAYGALRILPEDEGGLPNRAPLVWNDADVENEQTHNTLSAFNSWVTTNDVIYLRAEAGVHSLTYGFAGTLDAIAVVNGVPFILDYKTSNYLGDEYKLQLAAYWLAAMEMRLCQLEQPPRIGVLRLDKEDGSYEFRDFTENIQTRVKCFISLLDAYYLMKKRRLKNNRRVKEIWG